MLFENIKIILASKSPRRQALIKGLEFPFEVVLYDVDESYDNSLIKHEIPVYLALKKASFYPNLINDNEIYLFSPTTICIDILQQRKFS